MTSITLPPDLEEVIEEKARRKGTSTELFVIDDLRSRHSPVPIASPPVEGETMYDFLKDYIGSVDSSEVAPGGSNLSENTGKKFAELLLKEHRAGKL